MNAKEYHHWPAFFGAMTGDLCGHHLPTAELDLA